jgi:hypothetical protein
MKKIILKFMTVGILSTALTGCADVYYREANIDKDLNRNSFIISHGELVRGGDLANGYGGYDFCCEPHYHSYSASYPYYNSHYYPYYYSSYTLTPHYRHYHYDK